MSNEGYIGQPFYTTVSSGASSWLDYAAPAYANRIAQWTYARDHYTGECVAPWKVPSYLIRKKIGEAAEAYEERVLLADYTPHFGAVVDTLAGMLLQVEANATRVWGSLGDAKNSKTIAGRLMADADGDRTSLETLWLLAATDLVAIHDAWLLVDGGPDGTTPHIRLIPAESVTNWRHQDGVLVEALVKDEVDLRATIQDDPNHKIECQYVHYTTEGWTRYRKNRDTAKKAETAQAVTGRPYHYETVTGARTIPLVPMSLPLRRNVGYLMARKANSIFNKESERDHLLRFAAFPILNIVAADTLFKKTKEQLRAGSRVLQVMPGSTQHGFAAPSAEPAAMLTATIAAKVDEYYMTAFREFGAASQRKGRDRVTAAEVKSDVATGVSAFLGILRSAMDGAENAALYLLEQTVFPNTRARWGQAKVERSTEFAPFNPNEVIERMRTRYLGPQAVVPIGKAALMQVIKEIAEWDGVQLNESELGAAVDKYIEAQNPKPVAPTLKAKKKPATETLDTTE